MRSRSSWRASSARCGASARSVVDGRGGARGAGARPRGHRRGAAHSAPGRTGRRTATWRPSPAHLRLRRASPPGDLHGAASVSALARRCPAHRHRGARRAPHGRRRVPRSVTRWRATPPSGSWRSLGKIPAHLRLLRAARGRIPRRPLRPRHPDRLPGLPRAAGRGGAPARREGVVLHRAAALGLAAGARPAACGGGGPSGRRYCRSSRVFRRASGSAAEYVGHPLLDRPPRAVARGRARELRHRRRGAGAGALSRQPGPGDRAAVGAFPRRGRRFARRAVATGCWSPGTGVGKLPGARFGSIHPGTPSRVFAAADAALAKSGTTTLEAALPTCRWSWRTGSIR